MYMHGVDVVQVVDCFDIKDEVKRWFHPAGCTQEERKGLGR